VSCAGLRALPGGCAHELSSHDQAIATGTRVSDLCPEECGGHARCAPAVLDVGFLNTAEDSSGAGVKVTLIGDACVDAGGGTFSGDGHAELDLYLCTTRCIMYCTGEFCFNTLKHSKQSNQ
jgi:hypothetical protein